MNILLVNWQDRENPQAGGAEIHLFEIFGRLAARATGSGWSARAGPAPPPRPRSTASRSSASAAGTASRCSAAARCGARIRAERPDILVEDINKLPLYLPARNRAAVLRHRAPPVRRDRVRGGLLAGGRDGLAGRAAAPWAYRRARLPCDQREHAGRSGGARRPRRADPRDPSGSRQRTLHSGPAGHRAPRRRASCMLDG